MSFRRIAPILVAAGWIVTALLVGRDVQTVALCAVAVVVALPFVLWPEAFGNYVGPADMGYISRATPAAFVAFTGWILLIVGPLFVLLHA